MTESFQPISDNQIQGLLQYLGTADDFVFLETTRGNEENHHSYLFLEPVARVSCRAGEDPAGYFCRLQNYLDQGYYLAGWMAYELGYLLEPALASLGEGMAGNLLAEF